MDTPTFRVQMGSKTKIEMDTHTNPPTRHTLFVRSVVGLEAIRSWVYMDIEMAGATRCHPTRNRPDSPLLLLLLL
jgi:hypothetical protein